LQAINGADPGGGVVKEAEERVAARRTSLPLQPGQISRRLEVGTNPKARWETDGEVHEYVLVLPDGKYQVTKTNGPIGGQQSRQQVGGHAESFDPQLGEGFTAQINEIVSG